MTEWLNGFGQAEIVATSDSLLPTNYFRLPTIYFRLFTSDRDYLLEWH